MVIDFHTHVFPDSLAPKAKKTLTDNLHHVVEPVTDLTLNGLLARMKEWNISVSVTQPVITKMSQFVSTNEWVAGTACEQIVPFGGIYPHTDDYKRDIDYVVSLGLKGLKFHAEYQNFVVDDKYMLQIYDYAFQKGLMILQHGGEDIGMPAPYKSSPKQFTRIADELKGGTMIVAHFGGHAQWDEVERDLVGADIYFDTSMGFSYFSKEQFIRIVRAHGAERILFASDSPWSNAGDEIRAIESLSLTPQEKEMILSGNAKRLLSI